MVVGGGEAPARKVRLLAKAGAAIVVVAPDACAEIAGLAAGGTLEFVRRDFVPADLSGCALAFDLATGRSACPSLALGAHRVREQDGVVLIGAADR